MVQTKSYENNLSKLHYHVIQWMARVHQKRKSIFNHQTKLKMKTEIQTAIDNHNASLQELQLAFIQGHTYLDSLIEKQEHLQTLTDQATKDWKEVEQLLLKLELRISGVESTNRIFHEAKLKDQRNARYDD